MEALAPMSAVPTWLQWTVAAVLFVVIAAVGLAFLRGIGAGRPASPPVEPEDVADLDVFLVCGECGTEFQVTRLGEVQVPRHCGEPMGVERRPRHHLPT
jgi:hypothetical protein